MCVCMWMLRGVGWVAGEARRGAVCNASNTWYAPVDELHLDVRGDERLFILQPVAGAHLCARVCMWSEPRKKRQAGQPMTNDPSRTLHGRLRLTSTMRTAEGTFGNAHVARPRRVVQPWQQLPAVPTVAEAEADDMSRGGRRRRTLVLVLTIERRAAAAAAKAPVTRPSSIPVAVL